MLERSLDQGVAVLIAAQNNFVPLFNGLATGQNCLEDFKSRFTKIYRVIKIYRFMKIYSDFQGCRPCIFTYKSVCY